MDLETCAEAFGGLIVYPSFLFLSTSSLMTWISKVYSFDLILFSQPMSLKKLLMILYLEIVSKVQVLLFCFVLVFFFNLNCLAWSNIHCGSFHGAFLMWHPSDYAKICKLANNRCDFFKYKEKFPKRDWCSCLNWAKQTRSSKKDRSVCSFDLDTIRASKITAILLCKLRNKYCRRSYGWVYVSRR